jgi:hypothetical protein
LTLLTSVSFQIEAYPRDSIAIGEARQTEFANAAPTGRGARYISLNAIRCGYVLITVSSGLADAAGLRR